MAVITTNRARLALGLALLADALQLGALPFFVWGAASPWNDALDLAMGAAMVALLGWHWAFLPSFVAELVPLASLVPTWTAAVLIVGRGHLGGGVPEVTVGPPPPASPAAPAALPPGPDAPPPSR